MLKKCHLHWHIQFFFKYTQEGCNLFSLQIQIFHTSKNITPEFMKTWESKLSLCGNLLMQLLMQQNTQDIEPCDIKIMQLQTQHQDVRSLPSSNVMMEMSVHLQNLNTKIQVNKVSLLKISQPLWKGTHLDCIINIWAHLTISKCWEVWGSFAYQYGSPNF